jgi:hypothetical protein
MNPEKRQVRGRSGLLLSESMVTAVSRVLLQFCMSVYCLCTLQPLFNILHMQFQVEGIIQGSLTVCCHPDHFKGAETGTLGTEH